MSVFQGVFAFVLTGSILTILGVISSHVFGVFSCKNLVHLGWNIFGLAYIGVIAITFATLSVGSIGYGFCSYFSSMITTEASYSKLGVAYTQNAFMRIDTCIFGDGNAL